MKTRWLILALFLSLSTACTGHTGAGGSAAIVSEKPTALPNAEGSLKFVVLGDWGTGGRDQYNLAAVMARFHDTFKFDTVITVGDNLYGMQRPKDYGPKFEIPYKPLLDAGVKFYATLGNHDSRDQQNYALFNMGGKLYYTFRPANHPVRFFMLDSNYPSPEQIAWLEKELQASESDWKIAAFHHPLYSSGGRHGSDMKLREILEDLFVKNNVSVVFNGHDHFYERIKPQQGIVYFIVGSGGKLRRGDIDDQSPLTASGYDTGYAFLAVEIVEDKMYFNAIAETGNVVDSGTIDRRVAVATP